MFDTLWQLIQAFCLVKCCRSRVRPIIHKIHFSQYVLSIYKCRRQQRIGHNHLHVCAKASATCSQKLTRLFDDLKIEQVALRISILF